MAFQRFNSQIFKQFANPVRLASTTPLKNEVTPILTNRNPRNLEKLRIGYKPDGYHVDKKGRNFWHKLNISVSGRYVTATINHYKNGEVLKASTSEHSIQKHLYSATDYSAYVNLARVLAQRCLHSGVTEFYCNIEAPNPDGKIAGFLKTLEDNGLTLSEPEQFKPIRPWDLHRPEKPWEVTE